MNSTYYWRAVEGTNLAACVVLGGSGSETVLKINNYGKMKVSCMPERFVYVNIRCALGEKGILNVSATMFLAVEKLRNIRGNMAV